MNMKTVLTIVFVTLAMTALGRAQTLDLAGDWQGTLDTGAGQLRLALHITKAADGNLKATLDSIDQGANGIPVSGITLTGSKLTLDLAAVHGSYEGTLNGDASLIKGTWSQGQALPLDFHRQTAAAPPQDKRPAVPSDIDGIWMGSLDLGAMKLRMVFHITNTADGLTATADSPDQNAMGIPVTSVKRNAAFLKMAMKQLDGVFEGTISKDLETISGTWSQHDNHWPLVLKRVKDKAELERRRPQNPVKPYPYRAEEVSYTNLAQGDTLAATLTIPPDKGPFPAVLLITGSGPQDRDESLLGHKPFLVLSDWLTRKGIVVLRADDRGVGKSTGDFKAATTADFATDADAGVTFLKTRPEVNPHRIGLIGHSEGGAIAPMVAARNHDVAFIVMLAGPGVPGSELLVEQVLRISEATGMSHADAEKSAAKEREVLALIVKEKDNAVLEKELRTKLTGDASEAQLSGEIKTISSPWFRFFLTYDPATSLRKVTCPVLALNGSKDTQVSAQQNLPAIRKALEEGGNKHFEIVELAGLNHLFQTAKTGAPGEYAEIEETMSPVALDRIAGWILQQD